jgi:hypothetical protein
MPLQQSATDKAFRQNVATLLNEGRTRAQALAIAYRIKRGVNRDIANALRSPGLSVESAREENARIDRILKKKRFQP